MAGKAKRVGQRGKVKTKSGDERRPWLRNMSGAELTSRAGERVGEAEDETCFHVVKWAM